MKHSEKKKSLKIVRLLVAIFIMVIIGLLIAFSVWVHANMQDKNVYRQQGILDYNSGAYEQAIENLQVSLDKKALFAGTLDQDSRLYLADSYFLLEQYEAAMEQYDILLNTEMGRSEPQMTYLRQQQALVQGILAYQSQDYDTALSFFQTMIEDGHMECTLYAGVCASELGRQDEFVAYLTTYLSYNPDSAYACTELADYYLQQGLYDTCSQYLQRGMQASDRSCDAQLYWLEILYYEYQHDYNQAYQLICDYMQEYTITDSVQKEYDFLFTRQTIE